MGGLKAARGVSGLALAAGGIVAAWLAIWRDPWSSCLIQVSVRAVISLFGGAILVGGAALVAVGRPDGNARAVPDS
jgi:hypothetical protein